MAASPDEVARYVAGDAKTRKSLRGFFVGEVMRATANKANPRLVNQLLDQRLDAAS